MDYNRFMQSSMFGAKPLRDLSKIYPMFKLQWNLNRHFNIYWRKCIGKFPLHNVGHFFRTWYVNSRMEIVCICFYRFMLTYSRKVHLQVLVFHTSFTATHWTEHSNVNFMTNSQECHSCWDYLNLGLMCCNNNFRMKNINGTFEIII